MTNAQLREIAIEKVCSHEWNMWSGTKYSVHGGPFEGKMHPNIVHEIILASGESQAPQAGPDPDKQDDKYGKYSFPVFNVEGTDDDPDWKIIHNGQFMNVEPAGSPYGINFQEI